MHGVTHHFSHLSKGWCDMAKRVGGEAVTIGKSTTVTVGLMLTVGLTLAAVIYQAGRYSSSFESLDDRVKIIEQDGRSRAGERAALTNTLAEIKAELRTANDRLKRLEDRTPR